MLHELWQDPEDEGRFTFTLAGPMGDGARALLSESARVTWTVEAASHVEAMTKYYEHQGWGAYSTGYSEVDGQTYRERGWE